MSDNKITQDQLEPNVMEELESGIGDLSTLSTENKDSLVAAVTEIYGKNIIAEAIGEPLAVTDTFSEMGSEINSLLSSFKTNMMNSGVTVESGDKFKQLIDKIKGLTEGEGNKGIQYAEGEGEWKTELVGEIGNRDYTITIPINLDFTPTYIFCLGNFSFNDNIYDNEAQVNNMLISNIVNGSGAGMSIGIIDITPESFTVDGYYEYNSGYGRSRQATATITKWYAIGVGEEDTTLRDSLADILEDKGVDVTEEDDMASLITKVDEEFDKRLIPAVCTNGVALPLYSYTFDKTHNSNTLTDYEIGYTFFNGYVSIGYSWCTPNNTFGLSHLTFISKDKDGNIIHTSETFDDNTGFPSYYENIKVVYGGKLFARVDTFSKHVYKRLNDIVLYCDNIEF